jgi:hypothetical protein
MRPFIAYSVLVLLKYPPSSVARCTLLEWSTYHGLLFDKCPLYLHTLEKIMNFMTASVLIGKSELLWVIQVRNGSHWELTMAQPTTTPRNALECPVGQCGQPTSKVQHHGGFFFSSPQNTFGYENVSSSGSWNIFCRCLFVCGFSHLPTSSTYWQTHLPYPLPSCYK